MTDKVGVMKILFCASLFRPSAVARKGVSVPNMCQAFRALFRYVQRILQSGNMSYSNPVSISFSPQSLKLASLMGWLKRRK